MEYEQLRKVSAKLQEEVKILRGMLQERDQLIQVSCFLPFIFLCSTLRCESETTELGEPTLRVEGKPLAEGLGVRRE